MCGVVSPPVCISNYIACWCQPSVPLIYIEAGLRYTPGLGTKLDSNKEGGLNRGWVKTFPEDKVPNMVHTHAREVVLFVDTNVAIHHNKRTSS